MGNRAAKGRQVTDVSLYSKLLIGVFLVTTLITLVGLARRGRLSACVSFPIYLLLVATLEALWLFWPEQFWTYAFLLQKETLQAVAKLLLVAELGFRTMRYFPGASARARVLAGPMLFAAAILLHRTARGVALWPFLTLSQVQTWATWALLVLTIVVVYHNLPLEDFHRALLVGLATYSGLWAAILGGYQVFGYDTLQRSIGSKLNGLGWTVLVVYWTWAAWRPVQQPALSEQTIERLRALQAAA